MGIAVKNTGNTAAVFYRNGSMGVDSSLTNLAAPITFTNVIRKYTIPAGWSYDDIICADTDDDSNVIYLNFRNGSIASVASATLNADLAFTTLLGVNTLPANFNFSDVVTCSIDAAPATGDATIFFKNGSFINNGATESHPSAYPNTVLRYTLPAGYQYQDIIGGTLDTTANDFAFFFMNGSVVYNFSLTSSAVSFSALHENSSTYNSGSVTGNNITESTNVTIETRASNDTVTWTPWSATHINGDGEQLEQTMGGYLQYRAT